MPGARRWQTVKATMTTAMDEVAEQQQQEQQQQQQEQHQAAEDGAASNNDNEHNDDDYDDSYKILHNVINVADNVTDGSGSSAEAPSRPVGPIQSQPPPAILSVCLAGLCCAASASAFAFACSTPPRPNNCVQFLPH
ncbi:hypothetical protein AWZ03_015103 [Drosophila navojoa]|uniref:Uncharacterized protein n=1 Tax=Drosophila navojoa TaxID=7232 RepID=A0A484ASE1_DRONA|nr:hypothetical protein AWZ03_015103 [Drosophila navojoa]